MARFEPSHLDLHCLQKLAYVVTEQMRRPEDKRVKFIKYGTKLWWNTGRVAIVILTSCIFATASVYIYLTPGTFLWRKEISDLQIQSKPMVAICAPTRSMSDWKIVSDSSLQTLLIPSISRTVTPTELEKYRVHLYLGINDDDTFWIEHVTHLNKSHWLVVHAGFYKMAANRVPFNEVTDAAYIDGAEYIVRINDDTEFVTAGWITSAVQGLAGYYPSNVGVVGPICNEGNTAIMTHDMVHRTHRVIFRQYYPAVFDNWYVDDWITRVYEPDRNLKLGDWRVVHHTGKHGTRYKPNQDQGQHQLLQKEVLEGKRTVTDYIIHVTAKRRIMSGMRGLPTNFSH